MMRMMFKVATRVGVWDGRVADSRAPLHFNFFFSSE
jgi:hypothetical protein